MAIETKVDAIRLGVVEVVTVALSPDDIKPATGAIAKAFVDGNIQL
jgi:hypothetical protein